MCFWLSTNFLFFRFCTVWNMYVVKKCAYSHKKKYVVKNSFIKIAQGYNAKSFLSTKHNFWLGTDLFSFFRFCTRHEMKNVVKTNSFIKIAQGHNAKSAFSRWWSGLWKHIIFYCWIIFFHKVHAWQLCMMLCETSLR